MRVAIFDHLTNPRHPTWWHAREYGLIAANPFGIHDFENRSNAEVGNLTIPKGESVTFLYRVLLHKGDASEADVQGYFKKFAIELPESIIDGSDLPKDRRLEPLKDFDGHFPMKPPKSLTEWKGRADHLRKRIMVSACLWPMPIATPS